MVDDNQYECSKCNKKCDAKKRFSVEKSPRILVIQVLRFDNKGKKIRAKVRFPTKFSLKQFTSESVDRVAEGLPALDYSGMHKSDLKDKICGKTHKPKSREDFNTKSNHMHVDDLEIFNLYGFVIHEGNQSRKGHYCCVVKGIDD